MSSLSDIHNNLSAVCSMLDSLVQELEDVRNKLLNIRDVTGSRRGQN